MDVKIIVESKEEGWPIKQCWWNIPYDMREKREGDLQTKLEAEWDSMGTTTSLARIVAEWIRDNSPELLGKCILLEGEVEVKEWEVYDDGYGNKYHLPSYSFYINFI